MTEKNHQQPILSVAVTIYNQLKYLPGFFANLPKQTFRSVEYIFIDQDSTDGSADWIEKNHPEAKLIRNQNSGYGGGANRVFEISAAKYFMIWTVDVILEPDYLERAVKFLEDHSAVAAYGGKIYRYDFEHQRKTAVIDTVGELCTVSRRVIDDGQGLKDEGQFNSAKEVFGVSGQNPIYRRQALAEIKIDGRVWDENFFMYKEDVDVAWRLRLAGWKAWYDPAAIGYHVRGTHVENRFSLLKEIRSRKKLSRFQKYYSLSNHTLLLIKNELGSTFLIHFPFILGRLAAQYVFTLVTEPILFFKTVLRVFKTLPRALHDRHLIMKRKKIGFKKIWPFISAFKSGYLKSTK